MGVGGEGVEVSPHSRMFKEVYFWRGGGGGCESDAILGRGRIIYLDYMKQFHSYFPVCVLLTTLLSLFSFDIRMVAWEVLQSRVCSCPELSLPHSKSEEFILVPTNGNEESQYNWTNSNCTMFYSHHSHC